MCSAYENMRHTGGQATFTLNVNVTCKVEGTRLSAYRRLQALPKKQQKADLQLKDLC